MLINGSSAFKQSWSKPTFESSSFYSWVLVSVMVITKSLRMLTGTVTLFNRNSDRFKGAFLANNNFMAYPDSKSNTFYRNTNDLKSLS